MAASQSLWVIVQLGTSGCRASDPSVPLSLTSRDVPPPGTHSLPIEKVNCDELELTATTTTTKGRVNPAEEKIIHVLLTSISTFCSENLLWNLPRFLAWYLALIFLERLSTEMLAWRSNTEIQSPRNCVLSICTFTTLLLLPTIAFDDFAYQPHCGQLRKTHIVVYDVSAKWIFCMTLLSLEVLNQKVCSCSSEHIW